MQSLWISTSRDDEGLSPVAIRAWALIGLFVNLAFVGLVLFCC